MSWTARQDVGSTPKANCSVQPQFYILPWVPDLFCSPGTVGVWGWGLPHSHTALSVTARAPWHGQCL